MPCIPPMLSPLGHETFVEEGVPPASAPSPESRPQAEDNHDTSKGSRSPEASYNELQDFLQNREQKRRLYPRAVLVGALAGLLAVAFRWSLVGSEALRHWLIRWAHQYPQWGWLLPMLFGAVGAELAIQLVRSIAPEASGSSIPHLKAVLLGLRSVRWQRILPVKFIGGVLAIGGGLGLGREGPTVQMGGVVGEAASRWLKVTPRHRQTLIAAVRHLQTPRA